MLHEEVNSLFLCELSYFWITSDLQSHARILSAISGGYIGRR